MTADVIDLDGRRQPPLADTNEESGERFYDHPITKERWVSVTTAMQIINKPALVPWAGKMGATAAMEMLPAFVRAARLKSCGKVGKERCQICRECVIVQAMGHPAKKRDEGAYRGSQVHDVAEEFALSGNLPQHDEAIAPYVTSYMQWFNDYGPEYAASECTVANRECGYAGTTDGVIIVGGRALIFDIKTTEHVKADLRIYAEHVMQLAAYRWAEFVLLRDGRELPLPEIDGAAVLILGLDGYLFREVPCGRDIFGGWLAALDLWKAYEELVKPAVKGLVDYPRPDGQPTRPPRKRAASQALPSSPKPRAARKSTAKKATAAAKKTAAPAAPPSATIASMRVPARSFAEIAADHEASSRPVPRQLFDDEIPF